MKIIYSYTRKQAVEDGEQVKLEGELADLAKEAGWRFPVYLTRSVWNIIEKAVNNKNHLNDLKGVLWDILWMAARSAKRGGSVINFSVAITGAGRNRNWNMIANCGPTDIDDPSPAITIMLPKDQ